MLMKNKSDMSYSQMVTINKYLKAFAMVTRKDGSRGYIPFQVMYDIGDPSMIWKKDKQLIQQYINQSSGISKIFWTYAYNNEEKFYNTLVSTV